MAAIILMLAALPGWTHSDTGPQNTKSQPSQVSKKRTAQSPRPVNTYYIWSYDGKLLAEYDQDNHCTREYIYAGSRLIAEYRPQVDKYFYYMYDHLNSTRAITDDDGNVVFAATFGPYGGIEKVWVNTYDPRLKFSGKEREPQTGLDYFGARYYAPHLRRFLSPDPVINRRQALLNPQLWNLYGYCRNNPVNYLDPDGRTETPTARWITNRYQIYKQMGGERYAFNRHMYEAQAEFGGVLAIGAFLTGYFAPEIIASSAPIFEKISRQIQKIARISNGTYQKALDYALQKNKLTHYFSARHKLEPLIEQFGSEKNVVIKVLDSLGKLTTSNRGVFDVVRRIGGMDVRVTGFVQDGVIKIGNIMPNLK